VVGIAAVLVSLLVGVTLGLLSGFVQGRVDTVIMTVVDVTLSFPQILLALAFVAALGPSLVHDHRRPRADRLGALHAGGPRGGARLAREELRGGGPVDRGQPRPHPPAGIFSRTRVSSIIVMSTLQVAQAIFQQAALSFLGPGTFIPPGVR
jgi:peptide/nickel transport system permease protein